MKDIQDKIAAAQKREDEFDLAQQHLQEVKLHIAAANAAQCRKYARREKLALLYILQEGLEE